MVLPANIFRAYDIRGVYGKDLTPDVVAVIGGALSNFEHGDYCVCHDTRFSSPVLARALASGLAGAGSDVVDSGAGPIGMAIYASKHLNYHVAYITASHLPPEWNGIKLFRPGGEPICLGDIERIRSIAERGVSWASVGSSGTLRVREVLPEYFDFLHSIGKHSGGLRVLVDCGNGATSMVVPKLLRDLGYQVFTVNCDVDPRFPVRGSEPTLENTMYMSSLVREFKADLGVSFDGDGDRVIFFDETGSPLTPEQAAIVMLHSLGKAEVAVNVECSSIVDRAVAEMGGRVVRVPVGRIFMILDAVKSGAELGVESSGHFVTYRGVNLDDGIVSLLFMLEAVEKLGGPLSKYRVPMPPVKKVKLEVPDEEKFRIVDALKSKYTAEYDRVTTIDGVRVDVDRGWFLVRASNTEPVIRITIEAENAEELANLERKVLRDISELLKRKNK
ncbi:phosphomannomutase/phosphoglucomutase [Infirmifilum lucidum]|uniref:Phosphomannomutase/phosphoglucomutase n=1 Tax=Infirmifilum lucidum TaxID=2776706 RepID=A0A7L9FKR6_9CREN|nr:phosphomannomutase/phosphoglucomutase [Infirmifilum lucidum]QOJ79534.1 phosphomannomutase/phosphoglucomutase [Infirmifilum lucidum]